MTAKTNIAIMAGGNSSEAEISLRSAAQIANWLSREKYNVYTIAVKGTCWTLKHPELGDVPMAWDTFSAQVNGQPLAFGCALIAIHGTPGENGLLQAYFELRGIPYTTCGVMSSAVTFDKEMTKLLVRGLNVNLAKSISLRKGVSVNPQEVIKKLGLPIFVKPNESGSSYGISKVKAEVELVPATEKAFTEDNTILIEEFIPGGELTCGLLKTRNKTLVFPITEIVPRNEYFDYGAKYLNQSEEITPARISPELTEHIQSVSSEIYDRLKCRGIVRIDYINSNGKLYFLEINTVPGMSEASIVPQQVEAMGLTMGQVLDLVIEDALERGPTGR